MLVLFCFSLEHKESCRFKSILQVTRRPVLQTLPFLKNYFGFLVVCLQNLSMQVLQWFIVNRSLHVVIPEKLFLFCTFKHPEEMIHLIAYFCLLQFDLKDFDIE